MFRHQTSLDGVMVKLTNKKIKWAVNQVVTSKKSTKSVANIYKVSQRRIQQLVKIYKDTGEYPQLKMNRRPRTYLTDEQKELKNLKHSNWTHLHLRYILQKENWQLKEELKNLKND